MITRKTALSFKAYKRKLETLHRVRVMLAREIREKRQRARIVAAFWQSHREGL